MRIRREQQLQIVRMATHRDSYNEYRAKFQMFSAISDAETS